MDWSMAWAWTQTLLLGVGGVAWALWAFTKSNLVGAVSMKNDLVEKALFLVIGLAGLLSLLKLFGAI